MSTVILVLGRDLRLSSRRWGERATPLIFFTIVASLFPLALSPNEELLQSAGTGFLWIAALLSSLLALDGLFRTDVQDGSMEQLTLSPAPLALIALAKIVAHWIVSGVPLIVITPIIALSFHVPAESLKVLMLALLLATPTLSILAALGAALTVSVRGGGAIIGLLVLPLTSPVLIFGARVTDLAIHSEPTQGPLYLLAAFAVLSASIGPLACAAALRVGLE
ncbi:MAG: heme exporter protein CcmB [Candidatus Rariloculaceae bacterium]